MSYELRCFWDRVLVGDGCWEWQGVLLRNGYGQVYRNTLAHRAAYTEWYGSIPEGLEIDHLCKNRRCCRPDHLEPVTHLENIKRGELAQRTHCLRGHPLSGKNLYVPRSGTRQCIACRRLRQRKEWAPMVASAYELRQHLSRDHGIKLVGLDYGSMTTIHSIEHRTGQDHEHEDRPGAV